MTRVLIADDSPIFADILSEILGEEGDMTIAGLATDGAQAVSMARGLLAYVEGPAHVRAGQLLTARVNLPSQSPNELTAGVLNAVKGLPGVVNAGAATHVPRRDPPRKPQLRRTKRPDRLPRCRRAF